MVLEFVLEFVLSAPGVAAAVVLAFVLVFVLAAVVFGVPALSVRGAPPLVSPQAVSRAMDVQATTCWSARRIER